MDKKGFLLGISAKCRVICRKGRKNSKYTQDGNRELITVLECVSVEGAVLPPLVVTKGVHHYRGMHIKGQGGPGWIYGYCHKSSRLAWKASVDCLFIIMIQS